MIAGVLAVAVAAFSFAMMGMDAGETVPPRTIQAFGTATVAAEPDSARLYFAVSTRGETPTEAREENARRMAAVRNALLDLKLPGLKTKTRDVTVARVYGEAPEEGGTRPLVGFDVAHEFTILIEEDDLEQLNTATGKVLDTALENGVVSTRSVSFFKKDMTALARQAMSEAVEDALDNARAFAKGANVTVTDVVVIDGGEQTRIPSYYGGQQGQQGGFGGSAGLSTSFLAGKSQISCDVHVTCRFSEK